MMDLPRNRLFRAAAIAISLIFFYFFPTLVAASYMSWSGFFSYDMFNEGAQGITAFYWWAEIILLTLAIYLAGSCYFVAVRIINKRLQTEEWVIFVITAIINLIFALVIFCPDWNMFKTFPASAFVGMYSIAAWAMVHIAIVIHGSGKQALYSIGLGVLALCTVSVISPGSLALPYSLSLQAFGNGGNLNISVDSAEAKIEGQLVLASPRFYYIQTNNELHIVDRQTAGTPTIKNLSGFGHRRNK